MRTPSRALLVAAVVAIVLGIVGMHALNTHASTHAGMDDTVHAAMTGTDAHASAHAHAPESAAGSPTVGTTTADPGSGQGLGDLMMLCGAMLAGAAASLLLVLLGRRALPRVWVDALRPHATAARWVTARLGTGPPAAWRFSVVRC